MPAIERNRKPAARSSVLRSMKSHARRSCALSLCLGATATVASAVPSDPPLEIHRTAGEILIDGRLDDAGWQDAAPIDEWFETRPGDNIAPKVKNVAYLTYDDRYLYAAFEFADPEPSQIRAPLADRDNVSSSTDYGGVIVDATNDARTAQMFLANPRGIQYDALSSDAAGEDSAPDFYWDSASRVTESGWVLEMRIPFASLRYTESDPEQWGIMLYRNRPREYRYQMFTSRLPRDSTCFICNVRPLRGLAGLPSGSHFVVAPYANASQLSLPQDDLGSPLESQGNEGDFGLDAKWLPNPNTVIDAAINPDFSQIESDTAQISANERFALFFPEKRQFFLEGVDLFSTPIDAVFTRTFTSPRWGTRATGSFGSNTYTLLMGEDQGGGSVILPGSNSSDLADQDFESFVTIGRFRRDFGQSFASFLYSGREIDGGGHNRVLGPDFRWQATDNDVVSGQLLFSDSDTPERPDLAEEWDGRTLTGHAARLSWYRQLEHWDFYATGRDIGDGFRADNGFVPQVGYRELYQETGYTRYPENKPISRLRTFLFSSQSEDRDGQLLTREITPGFGFDARKDSFVRFEFHFDEVLAIEHVFDRRWVYAYAQFTPFKRFNRLGIESSVGDQVDFANDRSGDGATLHVFGTAQPTDHLEFEFDATRRWLDVTTEAGASGRLFTADVQRLRATYTFNARSWLRLIGQWVKTERRPDLYTFEVDDRSGSFGGSAVFAYKLNWQTVLYLGYADNRARDEADALQPADRQLFAKISYAFQR
jgi:Domain of unknown function (DUF5916)